MTAGVELRLRAVVAVGGPQRAHECQAVSVRGDVGKPVADFHAALPVLAEAHLKRKERVALVAVGVGHHQAFEGQFLRILHRGERSLGDGLARVLREHGLRVEALHVADPAVHEEPDHALGLGGEVWAAVGGVHRVPVLALASRWKSAPSARPVKPMPRSARKALRGRVDQPGPMASNECEAPTDGAEFMDGMDGLGFIGASQNHHG